MVCIEPCKLAAGHDCVAGRHRVLIDLKGEMLVRPNPLEIRVRSLV